MGPPGAGERRAAARCAGSQPARLGAPAARPYAEAVGYRLFYLQWMGGASQADRVRLVVGVLIFLGLLVLLTWRLNASYWRNVH